MNLVTAVQFEQALRAGGLAKSGHEVRIGRELHYPENPARVVVVQLSKTDTTAFRCGVAERVLDVADTWFLFPRYGALPSLGLVEFNDQSVAVRFGNDERRSLAQYLATRPIRPGECDADLYAVASEGQALVTWDHHTEDDGLSVQLQRAKDAAKLVASLCAFGSELQVFSKTWGDGGS